MHVHGEPYLRDEHRIADLITWDRLTQDARERTCSKSELLSEAY